VIVDGNAVDADLSADVAVIGAGPAGIVTALEMADAGFDVVLLESGQESYSAETQALADAAELDPQRHAAMSLATRRQVGGASTIWGGRCVPFDPVDFERRPWISDAAWPVSLDELTPYFQRACDWFACGRAVFDATETDCLPPSIVPGLPNDEVRSSSLERWSPPLRFGSAYADRIRRSPRLRLVTGATCTEIVLTANDANVDHLACRTLGGGEFRVRTRRYIVACGGLESTRLLLASRDSSGRAIGDQSDHLGRWYMAHLEGIVASIRFDAPGAQPIHGYEQDADGVFVRRRFSLSRSHQETHELPNIAAWLVHPELMDARHESGVLSLSYLALTSPLGGRLAPEALRLAFTGEQVPGVPFGVGERSRTAAHLRNIVSDPWDTIRFVADYGVSRVTGRRRAPGFEISSPENVYPLQYHGEHRPHRDSRVTLADERDRLGVPKLRIDVRFSDADVDGVVRAHEQWDGYLRRHGAGRVEYLVDDVGEAIRDRLGGGFHQSGTTRMSTRPEHGVVDADLAIHGLPTVHVASSSTFPTSSQANSTFMIVVFALRLVDHLKRSLS
jgi:choline dehydrogenase-like flavoprotein